MKIVADENVPLVREYFTQADELILKSGREITRADVLTADVLLVRSVTHVTRALLAGTQIKFVGSATTGIDHLDTQWLDEAGIKWYAAYGCNATAVVEYVVAVIAALKKKSLFPHRKLRAGVVGAGRIGSRVAATLTLLGFDVLCCDPLRREREPDFQSTPLEALAEVDLVTLHVPLTTQGSFATHHMIDKTFLQKQSPGCVLLNASRGEVVNFSDLKAYGRHLYWCLDVWEHEPDIDSDILAAAVIATPHIAGYSVQSKQRGVEMVYQAVCDQQMIPSALRQVIPYPHTEIAFANARLAWYDVILKIYDPSETTALLKKTVGVGAAFDELRKNFRDRYELASVLLTEVNVSAKDRVLLRDLYP